MKATELFANALKKKITITHGSMHRKHLLPTNVNSMSMTNLVHNEIIRRRRNTTPYNFFSYC